MYGRMYIIRINSNSSVIDYNIVRVSQGACYSLVVAQDMVNLQIYSSTLRDFLYV